MCNERTWEAQFIANINTITKTNSICIDTRKTNFYSGEMRHRAEGMVSIGKPMLVELTSRVRAARTQAHSYVPVAVANITFA